MLNIAFRTDASDHIGTGHVMRCLTLSTGLAKQGANIIFIARHMPYYLQELITSQGFSLSILNRVGQQLDELAHANWLGTSQQQDADETNSILANGAWDWLIVDHYALDIRWEKALRSSVKKIMVIDDIADRNHDCDILLDQNYYVDMDVRYNNKVPADCQVLVGPKYALLRDEFAEARKTIKPRDGIVKRVLVFFGGVDADNYTGIAIEALAGLSDSGIHVDVVIGAQHPCRTEIEANCAEQGFVCYVQTDRMAELMAAADFAIGAGGSASWERCCLGLPALLVALAENQVDIAKALNLIGACVYIGTKDAADLLAIQQAITKLLDTHNQLEMISRHAFSLVDGMGVNRVCQKLVC